MKFVVLDNQNSEINLMTTASCSSP